jgi:hypothetical protein
MIEFPFDTARAVADLALTGILARHPGVRFVVVDGELVAPLVRRIEHFSGTVVPPMNSAGGSGYCCTAA